MSKPLWSFGTRSKYVDSDFWKNVSRLLSQNWSLFPEAKSLQTLPVVSTKSTPKHFRKVRYNEGTEEVLRYLRSEVGKMILRTFYSQKILVQWNEKNDGIQLFTLCLHSQEGKTSGCKNVALISRTRCFFLMVLWDFALSQQQMQYFQKCFVASDRPLFGRNREADRNERKMWNCCKTKLHFLDVLLRFSTLVFFFQFAYIESF